MKKIKFTIHPKRLIFFGEGGDSIDLVALSKETKKQAQKPQQLNADINHNIDYSDISNSMERQFSRQIVDKAFSSLDLYSSTTLNSPSSSLNQFLNLKPEKLPPQLRGLQRTIGELVSYIKECKRDNRTMSGRKLDELSVAINRSASSAGINKNGLKKIINDLAYSSEKSGDEDAAAKKLAEIQKSDGAVKFQTQKEFDTDIAKRNNLAREMTKSFENKKGRKANYEEQQRIRKRVGLN